jgi:hypothetical protein
MDGLREEVVKLQARVKELEGVSASSDVAVPDPFSLDLNVPGPLVARRRSID